MTAVDEQGEPQEPEVADVPEPDQDPHEEVTPEELEEIEEAIAEPEPPPEQHGRTPEQWHQLFNKSDKAFEAYQKKIRTLWEEDADDLIPIVISPQAPPGFIHKGDAGRVPDDVKGPILEFFGVTREQDYEPDPEAAECSTCKGKGLTATGSKVGSNRTRNCPTCEGIGYTVDGAAIALGNGRLSSSHAPVDEQVAALVTADVDMWNEPRLLPNGERNENYGKSPQYKVPHPIYGITAGVHERESVV